MEIFAAEVAVMTSTSRRAFLTNTTLRPYAGPTKHVDPGPCPTWQNHGQQILLA